MLSRGSFCGTPKGPFRTKKTTTIAKIVNYYAAVFLLRPPNLLRRGPFLARKNVCNSQENRVRTSCAAIANHPAILKILRVVNLLLVVFLVRQGPLGNRKSTLGSTLGSTPIGAPRFLRALPRALSGALFFGGFPVLGSLAGRQTLNRRFFFSFFFVCLRCPKRNLAPFPLPEQKKKHPKKKSTKEPKRARHTNLEAAEYT